MYKRTVERTRPIRSIVKLATMVVGGAIIGALSLLLVGAIRGTIEGIVDAGYGNFGVVESLYYATMWTILGDWPLFGALLGIGVAILSFWGTAKLRNISLMKPKGAILVMCVVVGLVSTFAYWKQKNAKAIDAQCVSMCEALNNQDYQTAYAYVSPGYQQERTLEQFIQQIESKSFFWSACHLEPQRYIATFGNRARLFVGNVSFYTAYSGAVLELEKVNGVWCFTDRNYWALD